MHSKFALNFYYYDVVWVCGKNENNKKWSLKKTKPILNAQILNIKKEKPTEYVRWHSQNRFSIILLTRSKWFHENGFENLWWYRVTQTFQNSNIFE